MNRRGIIRILGISSYILFLSFSLIFGFDPGKRIANNFLSFARDMLKVLPCAFLLIGLFEVWIKSEVVKKHLGESSGLAGYIWAALLAGTTVGGLYISFPIAYSLYSKGAKLGVIFSFIGFSAVCRVPMAIFEVSFLGMKFTVIRILVSIPLIIIASELLGNYLVKNDYKIMNGNVES